MTAAGPWALVTGEAETIPGPFLVTNNPSARDAHGRMSHVWCISLLIRERDGSYCGFEGNLKIHGITHYAEIVPPQVSS